MDEEYYSDDEYWDNVEALEEESESYDFAKWGAEHDDILWKVWENLRISLKYTPFNGFLFDNARFIDFVEFAANTTTSAPKPTPQLPKPTVWNFTGTVEELPYPKVSTSCSNSHKKIEHDLPGSVWNPKMSSTTRVNHQSTQTLPLHEVSQPPQPVEVKRKKKPYIPPWKRQQAHNPPHLHQKKVDLHSKMDFPPL